MIITHVCARVIVQIYCRRSQFARGTGGCSRCWDWRRHAAAVCVGGSEHESVGGGGGRTDSGGIWKISHESSCSALKTRVL